MPDLTAGWEIIILGTGTVFVALIFLGLVVVGLEKIFGPKTPPAARDEHLTGQDEEEKTEPPIAAITAAIHAYRGDDRFKIIRVSHRGEEWARRGRQELINNKPEWKGS